MQVLKLLEENIKEKSLCLWVRQRYDIKSTISKMDFIKIKNFFEFQKNHP